MGLDISAYQKLTKCAKDYGDDYDAGYEAGAMYLTIIDSFANAADGYSGWYESSGEESFGFRAGSYGGYNTWRAWLAQLVGPTSHRPVAGATACAQRFDLGAHVVGGHRGVGHCPTHCGA